MFSQQSYEHSSPMPCEAIVYGHRVFTPSGTPQCSTPVVSDTSVPFGTGMFDRPPVVISWSERLNLSSGVDGEPFGQGAYTTIGSTPNRPAQLGKLT